MVRFFNAFAVIGSAVGAVVAIAGVATANGAPQQAASAAVGIAFATIPYCFARLVADGARDAGRVPKPASAFAQAWSYGAAALVFVLLSVTVVGIVANKDRVIAQQAVGARSAANDLESKACEFARGFAHDRFTIAYSAAAEMNDCAGASVHRDEGGLFAIESRGKVAGKMVDYGAVVKADGGAFQMCRFGQAPEGDGAKLVWTQVSDCTR